MQINDANKVYARQPPLLSHEAGEADDEMECMPHISQYQTLSLSLGDPYLHSDMRPYANPTNPNMQYDATYLKAAQDLLDEFVNLYKPMKMVKNSKAVNESSNNGPHHYLSPSHCQDLRNKLFCMLDEVDRRFRQYEHEMQAVVSSFEAVAGTGAAIPYTLLALQTISRQFRRLRDAIKKHIQATQNVDPHHSCGVLSRLRRVDQQLREQKALQQLVAIRQPWRPQRGLPETAVTALRAWLFEHFLHPYPTDSEKMVLARETGLTRSQVANWFINARVRLWKPMIEEIYKEEFGGAELESLHETASQQISASDEREEASASLACMRLQHPAKHTAEKTECQGNDASSSSIIVDRLEHYYMGAPGNNHSRFSNAPLLSDFVA